ncbi:MAG: energy-coupling factor transporter transmembrane component T [Eubacteriales bacterium]|nr:energy-coupling factor transporter transmembrane component T [Eubacteriales bacterium]
MLKDVTLGQYFPGDTIIHRLDPRTKLIVVVLFIVALFQAQSWLSYAAVLAAAVICMVISHIKPKNIFNGLKPMLIVIVLTAFLNMFYTEGTPVIPGWIITWEGIDKALKMILRIVLLITGTFLLTYTTSPMSLTDGLEYLMSPLKKIKVPVHEMTMMMSMALRFIPSLIEETDRIMSAQRARGADFESGGLIKRAKALIPVLVPLFVSAFRRADDLAVAMECRCYHGGEGRTRMKVLRMSASDWIALAVSAAFLILIILMKKLWSGV